MLQSNVRREERITVSYKKHQKLFYFLRMHFVAQERQHKIKYKSIEWTHFIQTHNIVHRSDI